jgi:ureidoacrylate peracid hydrolase
MHTSQVPSYIVERVAAARDSNVPLEVNPRKTAHLVIDMQNGFMAPGALVEVPVARDIVPSVNRISATIRESGGVNVFVRFKVDFGETHYWSTMFDRMSPSRRQNFVDAFGTGAAQFQLWPGLEVRDQDLIVDKTRFSAFIPGTCDLHEKLQQRNVDTLVITGTATNCCCESTARDAMQLGYKVLFVSDCTATYDDESHNATLAAMAGLFFADVCTVDETLRRINFRTQQRVVGSPASSEVIQP